MKRGRPSKFSRDLADEICKRIALGESLRSVCESSQMPDKVTVLRWLSSNSFPEFCTQYTKARQSSLEVMADDLNDIADTGANDWMERNDPKNPGYIANGEHINRSRLRIDTRKWIMSKLAPKKYGERVELAGDPESPLVQPIDEIEIARIVAFLLTRAAKKQEA